MSQKERITERHMDWYSIWRTLQFTKTFLQVKRPQDPDNHEICKLIDVAAYMARLNTIAVDAEGVDSSLVDPDEVISAQLLQAILENPEGAAEVLEKSGEFESFEMVEID